MLSENAIMAHIGQKVESCINDEDGDLSDRRQALLNYYRGEPYGNEKKGYSKVVTREAFETIEWAMPLILKAFVGSDKAVVFDPTAEDDIEQAEQETDYVNHILLKQNKGFLHLHHWFKDTLMYPNGYIKAMPEEKVTRKISRYNGLTEAQLVELGIGQEGGPEVLEQDSYEQMIEQETPLGVQQVPIMLYDVKLREKKVKKSISIEAVPPEQVLIDDQVRSIDLDNASFVCHRVKRTKTELIDMGYDADKLERVGSTQDYTWNDEAVNRLFHEDENPEDGEEDTGAMQNFWVHECYLWLDVDEDGIAEFRRINTVGGTIFENEETDYQPMIAMSAILMSHQHAGIGFVEAVDDLQLVISTLIRNLLDNIYRINKPRKYVSESVMMDDGSTYDALLDAQAEIVPMRGDPHAGTKQEEATPLVGEILPVIQALDDRVATRTGIAPQLSLDPSVLQDSTMGAFMGALEKANERLDMVIRIFAETGMRTLMQKIHQLAREFQDVPKMIQLRGSWVEVDPSSWQEREDMTVQVGLGFNNKMAMAQVYRQLLELQKEAMAGNLSDPQKIYKTLEKLLDVFGLNVFEHFIDPSQPVGVDQAGNPIPWQPPQPQPDPTIELAKQQIQMDAQNKQAATQQKAQAEQLRHQRELLKLQEEHEERMAEIRNTEADTALTLTKAASEDVKQVVDIASLNQGVDQAVNNAG